MESENRTLKFLLALKVITILKKTRDFRKIFIIYC